MAIINNVTGYYGFVVGGIGGSMDGHGQVNRCLVAIVYPHQNTNINFEISKHDDDWAAQMGDGSIIPLSNPQVLYVNRDGAIIQFDMDQSYPSNSPCFLVYRSDTACFKITNTNAANSEFRENHASGYFAFTTEGYGRRGDEQGQVSKLMATFQFPVQSSTVKFSITSDPTHWAARMGDGSIINLSNPEVVATNYECAVVVFDMDQSYPSNSPAIILYKSKDAHFSVIPDETKIIRAVKDIKNVPTTIVSGVNVDLSSVTIEPYNATKQSIEWSIVSGNAIVTGDKLVANSDGLIKLKATIRGGADETEAATKDFVKEFSINATQNTITVAVQPDEYVEVIVGKISRSLSVMASSISNDVHYKWYINTSPSTVGARPVGCIEPTFKIPTTLSLGTYYYYCEISSPGAQTVTSRISKVIVASELTNIIIRSPKETLKLEDEVLLIAEPVPSTAILPLLSWNSSDVEIIQVDANGRVTVMNTGTANINVESQPVNGKIFKATFPIIVDEFIAVQDIINVPETIETDTSVTLNGTVIPNNSDYRVIEWSLVDPGTTNATLNNGILRAQATGTIVVRALIHKGKSPYTNFIKEIAINVKAKFIPITDIDLIGVPDEYRVGDPCNLGFNIKPENSSVRYAAITIASPGTTGATLNGNALKVTDPGTITLTITAVNGGVNKTNFSKTVQIKVKEKFVAAEGIVSIPNKWTYKNIDIDTFDLSVGEVSPSNATNKSISYRIKSDPGLGVKLSGKILTIDHSKITWWVENPDAVDFEYYSDKYKLAITDPLVIEATVKDGKGTGINFVIDIPITVESSPSLAIHIGLDSIAVIRPSIMRAKRPILNRFSKVPWNATNGAIHLSMSRLNTGQQGFSVAFKPIEQSEEYWYQNSHIEFGDDYDWTLDEYYFYLFEDGVFKFEYSVENGTADKRTFTSEEDVEILPEYIPVYNIRNIPSSLPKNSSTLLFGEPLTNFNVKKLSTEVYDVEVPSYGDIVWSVVDPGSTGATIKNGKLTFTSTGTCKIKATIESGLSEDYDWYDRHINEKSYEQLFSVIVTSNESSHTNPIVTLTLIDGTIIKIYKESELYNLSNDLPDTTEITAGGVTFRKNQVVEIKFWEDKLSSEINDDTIPITNITTNGEFEDNWSGETNTQLKSTISIVTGNVISTRDSADFDTPVLCAEMESPSIFDEKEAYYQLPNSSIVLNSDGEINQYKENGEDKLCINVLEELGFTNYEIDFTKLAKLFTLSGIEVKQISEKEIVVNTKEDDDFTRNAWVINDKGELLLADLNSTNEGAVVRISRSGNIYSYRLQSEKFVGEINDIAEVFLYRNAYIYKNEEYGNVILSSDDNNGNTELIGYHDAVYMFQSNLDEDAIMNECMNGDHIKIPYCKYDEMSIIPKLTFGNNIINNPTPSSYFNFDSNGTITGLTDEGSKVVRNLIIPSKIDGIDVKSTGMQSFNNNMTLKSLIINEGMKSIGSSSFCDCYNLESVSLPSTLRNIGSAAFAGCKSLTSVTIPEGVTFISDYSFNICTALKSINIPSSVTGIGVKTFNKCDALTDVYFGGTEEQWNAINIGSDNGSLANANIHFNVTIANEDTQEGESVQEGIFITLFESINPNNIENIEISSYENICHANIQGFIFNIDKESNSDFLIYGNFNDESNPSYFDVNNDMMVTSYLIINENTINIKPTDSTKGFGDITFSLDASETGSKMYTFLTNPETGEKDTIIAAGSSKGNIAIEINVEDGLGIHGQNYRDILTYSIGTSSEKDSIAVNPVNKKTGYMVLHQINETQYFDISANVIGINLDGDESSNIKWEISGMKSSTYSGIKTGETTKIQGFFKPVKVDIIESSYTGSTVKVAISKYEVPGSELKLTATYGNKSVDIYFRVFSKYAENYAVSKLTNFARNFTSLTKIDRIPDQITGDHCLRNFLKGCTSFNQALTIPEYVEGESCLEGFLSDCTSFNQEIVIPDGITGKRCLTRFLSGCTSFNKQIIIPEGVTGDYCLMRFLAGCTSFNQHIDIPENVAGRQCLDHFLFGCIIFNQDIEIPKYISGVANLRGFMRDTMKMTSTVTISQTAADNMEGNGLTLACFVRDDAYDIGVRVTGDGADTFMNNLPNMVMLIPLRRLIRQ